MEPRPREHQVPDARVRDRRPASPPPAREPTHAERVRTLVHGERRGALSTVAADPAGYPFGSVVSFGLADDGDPLLFVSLMAEHTQNALRDPRASLLVTEPVPEGADPLASGRVTLLGLLAPIDDDGGARRRPGALPRGQPGRVVLHRLRRLHVPAADRRPRALRRRLRAHELGRRGRVPRRDTRSARRRRGRDHRAHERRPRRRPGVVLPALRRARRHRVGHHVGRRPLRLRPGGRERRAPDRGPAWRSPTSAPPATRCAAPWSRWSAEARAALA